jgi:hypothetical protein
MCCTGDCVGPAAAGVTCCPSGGFTGGTNACTGEGFNGMACCSGGQIGCVCSNDGVCCVGANVCNTSGNCVPTAG